MLLRVSRYLLLLVLLRCPRSAFGHEVPSALEVNLWLRPQGENLDLLLRVPLRALRDIPFPERADGSLDVPRLLPSLAPAVETNLLQRIHLSADGQTLAGLSLLRVQLSLPSDRSFASWDTAKAHIAAAVPVDGLRWEQVFLDVHATTPIRHAAAALRFDSSMHQLAQTVSLSLRVAFPSGVTRAYHWTENPGPVHLDPSAWQATASFVKLGFLHILEGTDHILFVCCLILPLRRFRSLLGVITAFTLAHSLTLGAAVFGWAPEALWFPSLVETLIAASIFYMAVENICWEPRWRWPLAFGFGLIHGFGFSFALSEAMQFAGEHKWVALLSFNVGVELGQMAVLLLVTPLVQRMPGRLLPAVLSALIAHTAWHWMLERWEQLRRFPWSMDASPRWLAGIAFLLAGAGALVYWRQRLASSSARNNRDERAQ